MTYQEKIDFLESYQLETLRIYGLAQEAKQWREIAMCTASNNDGTPGSGEISRKVQNNAVKAADLVAIINKEIAEAEAKRELVKKMMEEIQNQRHRLLMELHYINGLSISEIAVKYDKSEKWIRELVKNVVNTLKFK
jgi:DNA-directed RNA polymerase specialized sigma24 family protein